MVWKIGTIKTETKGHDVKFQTIQKMLCAGMVPLIRAVDTLCGTASVSKEKKEELAVELLGSLQMLTPTCHTINNKRKDLLKEDLPKKLKPMCSYSEKVTRELFGDEIDKTMDILEKVKSYKYEASEYARTRRQAGKAFKSSVQNSLLGEDSIPLSVSSSSRPTASSTSWSTSRIPMHRTCHHIVKNPITVPKELPIDQVLALVGESFHLKVSVPLENSKDENENRQVDAFDVLMACATKRKQILPQKRSEVNRKVSLQNSIISLMEEYMVGFPTENIAENVVNVITNAVWYISPFYKILEERGAKIPVDLKSFENVRDWKGQKKAQPRVSATELLVHVEKLGELVTSPYRACKEGKLHDLIGDLYDGLRKYHNRLVEQLKASSEYNKRTTPIRSRLENWELKELPIKDVSTVRPDLVSMVISSSSYQIISLEEYLPPKKDRPKFIEDLAFSVRCTLFTYRFGNSLGNTYFLWKKREGDEENEKRKAEISAVQYILDHLPYFTTRAVRNDFIDKYQSVTNKATLRAIWKELTEDKTASANKKQQEVDDRVKEFFLNCDGELIPDLRKNNGCPKNTLFDTFWEELGKLIDEKSAVHERRSTDTCYFSDWVGVRDLIQEVLERCPNGTVAPSEQWVSFQFFPTNPYIHSAAKYTGKYKVKRKVQQRLLRSHHVDSSYCWAQWQFLKHMMVMHHDVALLVCSDDKAIVPVGSPGNPVSTGVRGHHKTLNVENNPLLALDHDYHIAGLVPSVDLIVNIPEDESQSFHRGRLVVNVKDKFFQPSNPFRHAAELINTISELSDPTQPFAPPPKILGLFTDGGPDHNNRFKTVQMGLLNIFVAMDLDMLIAIRCAPHHSYQNPAERCMSTLNLGLQGSSLVREEIQHEGMIRNMTTLKSIRDCAKKNSQIKDELSSAMKNVADKVIDRFNSLRYSDQHVAAGAGCSTDDIADLQKCLEIFDIKCDDDGLTDEQIKKTFSSNQKFKDFFEKHCRVRQYNFQIMKCKTDPCWYCLNKPPKLDLDNINFLPDPTYQDGEWRTFDELYDQTTNDQSRPSHQVEPGKQLDENHKQILKAEKVRGMINCSECKKPRCIYGPTSMNIEEKRRLNVLKDNLLFVCGDELYEGAAMITRRAIDCSSPIEVLYYSANVGPKVCFHCGSQEVLDEKNDLLAEYVRSFHTVRPICRNCIESGKAPRTRGRIQMNKGRN